MTGEQQELTLLEQQLGVVHIDSVEPRTEQERWLIPGVVHSTNTLLYGASSAGKSLAVAHIIASLTDGRDFLGITPYAHGVRVLVLCSDTGAELEYKERLDALDARADVDFLTGVGIRSQAWWNTVHQYARRAGHGLVVIDHASGVLDGDEMEKPPWKQLWQERVAPFGIPVILVAHASDYVGPSGRSHRPMGNSGASHFARCEVEIYRTSSNAYADSVRVLRSKSRDGLGVERRYRIVDQAMVRDEQAEEQAANKTRQRSVQSLDKNARVAQLAAGSAGKNKTEVARDIAEQAGLSVNSIRAKKLAQLEKGGLLVQSTNSAGGIYSPGPALQTAVA